MNDLVEEVAEKMGLEVGIAEKAIGYMLAFLDREADGDAVEQMMAAIPDASDLVVAHNENGGSMFGGIMGLGQQLMHAGLGVSEINTLARQTMQVARQHAGDEVVDRVIASVPGLNQFV